MNALELIDVTVQYPSKTDHALKNVSTTIKKNAITMVIGPNGSGKSTLLKAILGLVPFSGKIQNNMVDSQHATGYVPQRFQFDFSIPLTVNEFLSLALTTCTHTSREKEKMVKTALSHVHGKDLHDQTLGSLSGGQLQRILLARALVHDPSLLILDEPEAGVDISGEQVFFDILKELVSEKKKTILITSHELELVSAYANNVICLNKTVLCSGKPQTVLSSETFEQLYKSPLGVYRHGC
jgi:zinc/manganese transport system ATP-binding protein